MLTATFVVAAYVVLVLIAEALIWRIQPSMDGGVTLYIQSDDGEPIERTVDGYEHDGALYVSSNHRFRAWYRAALRNPNIEVLKEGLTEPQRYTANAVVGGERARVLKGYEMGIFLRCLCGFAPSKFIRFEPVA